MKPFLDVFCISSYSYYGFMPEFTGSSSSCNLFFICVFETAILSGFKSRMAFYLF